MATSMRPWQRILLGISGAIPVLGFVTSHNATLLIFTLFVVALLGRQFVAAAFARVRLPAGVKFVLAIIVSGWLTECFAWLGSYLNHDKNPALFHPQLIPDLILAIGFYGGWAVAWLLVLRRWQFTLGQVFVTTGIFGIFVEQNGAVAAVILASLAIPVQAALLALYVFAVYGAIMGLPYLLAGQSLPGAGERTGWLKYPAILAGMFIGGKVLFLVVALLASPLHLIPPRQPIWEHPFF
jgi:hypothetical protein